jgi:hypothetical protein
MSVPSMERMLLLAMVIPVLVLAGAAGPGLQRIGRIANGPCFDLVEKDGYLFAAQGGEVRVYDVSSPERIAGLTWSAALDRFYEGDAIRGLTLDGNVLYIADYSALGIADISDPRRPVVRATLPLGTEGRLNDVAVKGSTAYLAVEGTGILVADVSDRGAPVLEGAAAEGGSDEPGRMAVSGDYLYVGTASGLEIYDIANPGKPLPVGSYPGGDSSYSAVAVKGSFAYAVEYYQGVRILDISDPSHPVSVGSVSGMNANDIRILGDYAFVSTRYEGFRIYDISAPGSMEYLGTGTGISGYTEGIFPTETRTYLAAESMGFGIWDTEKADRPRFLVQVFSIGGVDSLAPNGRYLYLGGHNVGIWVVDVGTPSRPREVSLVENGGRNYALEREGTTLYAAADWDGLCIYDLTKPESPSPQVEDYGKDLMYVLGDGTYVYTGGSNSGFTGGIVDVSNRASPKLVATSPAMKGKFAKFGTNYLLVADTYGTGGLHILDVTDKKRPALVADYRKGTAFSDVALVGDTVVAATGNGIITLDLGDVRNPRLLDTLSDRGWVPYTLAADGATVYASGYGPMPLRAFDLSNPSDIRLIEGADLPFYDDDPYTALAVDAHYVYTGTKWGAFILSKAGTGPAVPPSGEPTPVHTLTQAPSQTSGPDRIPTTLARTPRSGPSSAPGVTPAGSGLLDAIPMGFCIGFSWKILGKFLRFLGLSSR